MSYSGILSKAMVMSHAESQFHILFYLVSEPVTRLRKRDAKAIQIFEIKRSSIKIEVMVLAQ